MKVGSAGKVAKSDSNGRNGEQDKRALDLPTAHFQMVSSFGNFHHFCLQCASKSVSNGINGEGDKRALDLTTALSLTAHFTLCMVYGVENVLFWI